MSDQTQNTHSEEPRQPAEAKIETPPAKPSVETAPESKPAPGRAVPIVGILALILAAAAGALAVFDFTRWQQQAPENAAVAGDVADLTKQLAVIETAQRETAAGFEEEIRQLKKSEATFNTSVQEISAKLGRTTISWRLAEVEHLLTIANARLALDRDRRTALIALENADSKLQLIDDPGLLPVRKHIVADVMALNAIDEPDIAGMALTLGSLTEAVAHLPILAKTPPGDANVGAEDDQPRTWRRMLHAAWEDLKSLVRVRRHDQPVEPLLPPDQEWYLRQNLRLKLEQARLALLSRETVLFRQSLAESGRWLTAFFDPQTPAVASLSKTLDDLGRVELNPELPDISASLRELRGHMRRLDEQVAGSGRKGGAS